MVQDKKNLNIPKSLPLFGSLIDSIHGVESADLKTTRALRIWPSASTTCSTRPTGAPFLTGMKVTVTSSPGLNESLLQPRLTMSAGLLVGVAQCTMLLLSSFASNFRKQWGLAQNHSVTLAFTVIFFVVSYAAAPWCANSGAETVKRPKK